MTITSPSSSNLRSQIIWFVINFHLTMHKCYKFFLFLKEKNHCQDRLIPWNWKSFDLNLEIQGHTDVNMESHTLHMTTHICFKSYIPISSIENYCTFIWKATIEDTCMRLGIYNMCTAMYRCVVYYITTILGIRVQTL